jgi:hypothetical protein
MAAVQTTLAAIAEPDQCAIWPAVLLDIRLVRAGGLIEAARVTRQL